MAQTPTEFLTAKGWKLIGTKRHKYGIMECWVPPTDSPAAEHPRAWWTQGQALGWQRHYDKYGYDLR